MERSTRQSIVFSRPFRLENVDGVQPAGAYEVETVERLLDQLSFVAFVRVSTTIALVDRDTGARQVNEIDPGNLADALRLDQEHAHAPP